MVLVLMWLGPVLGQAPSAEDQNIRPIRGRDSIGATDQRLIGEWVQVQVTRFESAIQSEPDTALMEFRRRVRSCYADSENSAPFKAAFAAQTAEVASARFQDEKIKAPVARGLARVLLDLGGMDTLPALLAGLKHRDAATRYLCARGLADLRGSLGSGTEGPGPILSTLKEAAGREPNSEVLARLYAAIQIPQQVPIVADALLDVMEGRFRARRGPDEVSDGAEIEAYEFFRSTGVVAALSAEQKSRLVSILGGSLRRDVEGFLLTGLNHDGREMLRRRIDGAEAILEALAGKGGDLRNELSQGGHERSTEILKQLHAWVGDPKTNEPGTLNVSPWDLGVGAP